MVVNRPSHIILYPKKDHIFSPLSHNSKTIDYGTFFLSTTSNSSRSR